MAEYTGTFSVQNNTGGTITNVSISHTTTDWPGSVIQVPSLADGGTAAGGMVDTSTSNLDRWTISFINAQGVIITGYENCGFEKSDNGKNVVIVLCQEYFNVIMPASSSCDDNKYHQS
jgi:hypothetical protein